MASAETAKLIAQLDLGGNFTKNLGAAQRQLGTFSKGIAKSRAVAVGVGIGLERAVSRGISMLGDAISDGIAGFQELERTQAQTQAVITSTGGAAGVTAQQIRDMAEAQEDLTTADDKTIQQGQNLLLTFTNIGKEAFPLATEAMVNMAIAMNKGDAATADFDGTAIQLGKALNDPIKGITALSRVGVSFNKDQKEAIQTAVEAGDTYKAQAIILAELEKEFGEAGKAAGTGFTADINRANDAIEDAKIDIATGLMPALGEVARELSATLKDPAVKNGLRDLGVGIGEAIRGLTRFAKQVPWSSIANSLQAAAGFAKGLLEAFLGMPDWVKTAVITGWGLNKLTGGAVTSIFSALASGLIKGVLGMTAGVVNINAGVVKGPGGGLDLPGTIGKGAAGAAATGAGITVAAVAALVLAPVAIAAAGLLVTKLADPKGIRQKQGTADIATARGVPDWNNKALNELKEINANLRGEGKDDRGLDGAGMRRDEQKQAIDRATTAIEKMKGSTDLPGVADQIGRNIETMRGGANLSGVRDASQRAGVAVQGQVSRTGSSINTTAASNASRIVGAINSIPAPIVNVNIAATTFVKTTNVTERGGNTTSDRGGPLRNFD